MSNAKGGHVMHARDRLWKAVCEVTGDAQSVTVSLGDLLAVLRETNREHSLSCAVRRAVADYQRGER